MRIFPRCVPNRLLIEDVCGNSAMNVGMPRSRAASKTSEPLSQQSAERVASPDDEGGSDEDSDEDILETGQNGRYQKMIEQVIIAM